MGAAMAGRLRTHGSMPGALSAHGHHYAPAGPAHTQQQAQERDSFPGLTSLPSVGVGGGEVNSMTAPYATALGLHEPKREWVLSVLRCLPTQLL